MKIVTYHTFNTYSKNDVASWLFSQLETPVFNTEKIWKKKETTGLRTCWKELWIRIFITKPIIIVCNNMLYTNHIVWLLCCCTCVSLSHNSSTPYIPLNLAAIEFLKKERQVCRTTIKTIGWNNFWLKNSLIQFCI